MILPCVPDVAVTVIPGRTTNVSETAHHIFPPQFFSGLSSERSENEPYSDGEKGDITS